MVSRAERQRRYRQRVARGETIYRVQASSDVLDAIISSGRLSEAEALIKPEVEKVITQIVFEWAFTFFVTRNGR